MITIDNAPQNNRYYFADDPLIIDGTISSPSANTRVICTPQVAINGNIYDLTPIYYELDADFTFHFNLKEYLSKLWEIIEKDFPDPDTNTIIEARNNYAYVAVTLEEAGGTPLSVVDTQYVFFNNIPGGIAWEQYNTLQYTTLYQPSNKSFLTWDRSPKKILIDQPEFLLFMLQTNSTNWKVEVKTYNNVGTLLYTVENAFGTTVSSTAYPYIIPVGFDQLNLGSLSTPAAIARYTVQVKNSVSNAVLTELYTFELDRSYYRNKKLFYYVNSLGGISSLVTFGEREYGVEISRTTINRYIPGAYDVKKGQRKTRSVSQNTVKVNTGFMSRDNAYRMQDELLSSEVYELVKVDRTSGPEQVFFPVEFTNSNVKLHNEGSFLHAIQLEYKYNFKNNRFTPLYQHDSY